MISSLQPYRVFFLFFLTSQYVSQSVRFISNRTKKDRRHCFLFNVWDLSVWCLSKGMWRDHRCDDMQFSLISITDKYLILSIGYSYAKTGWTIFCVKNKNFDDVEPFLWLLSIFYTHRLFLILIYGKSCHLAFTIKKKKLQSAAKLFEHLR